LKAKHDKSAQKAFKGLNCPDYYLKGLILSDFNDKRSFKEYKKNEDISKTDWENGPIKNTFSTKRRHRGRYFQKWGLVHGRQHKGGLNVAEKDKKTYAVVLIEIDTDKPGYKIDRFHRWRRFVNRPSNARSYGVKVINWRIPSRAGFRDG